jgi:hypothetical protein
MEYSLDVLFGLTGEIELFEPLLHSEWLDFSELDHSPCRPQMLLDHGEVSSCCAVGYRNRWRVYVSEGFVGDVVVTIFGPDGASTAEAPSCF